MTTTPESVCPKCGSATIDRFEKCAVCGTAIPTTPSPLPVQQKQAEHQWSQSPGDVLCIGFQPTCERCGAPIETDTKTCEEFQEHQAEQIKERLKDWRPQLPVQQRAEGVEADDYGKALKCLYIAVEKSVADDVNAKVRAYVASLQAQVDSLEMERDKLKELVSDLEAEQRRLAGQLGVQL